MKKASFVRKTTETDVSAEITVNSTGVYNINTGCGFFDHMLEQFSRHSLIDITVKSTGDFHIDQHHIVEDTAIVLGECFKRALGNKKGIERYGFFILPMDEALVESSVDFGGRPYLVLNNDFVKKGTINGFDTDLVREFFHALAYNAGMNIHINVRYGNNDHHIIEAIFKSTARAIRNALTINENLGINSTKGTI